jgi:hypothetical protein
MVRVYRSDSPSYDLHVPTPGTGPATCILCVHKREGVHRGPEFCSTWTCGAVPGEVRQQAGTDPLTGEHVPALVVHERCKDRNPRGECTDFDMAPAEGFRPTTTDMVTDAKSLALGLSFGFCFLAGAVLGGLLASM